MPISNSVTIGTIPNTSPSTTSSITVSTGNLRPDVIYQAFSPSPFEFKIGYSFPKLEKAIFNPPATILIWKDGSKTIVRTQNNEPFDKEKGFVMAYLKKMLGNDNTFNKEIHKWVKEEEEN